MEDLSTPPDEATPKLRASGFGDAAEMRILAGRSWIRWVAAVAVLAEPPATASTIRIIQRRTGALVCTGVCPDYDLTVSSGGRVHSDVGRGYRVYDFRIARSQEAEFARLIQQLRPSGRPQPMVTCEHPDPVGPSGPALVIRWSGTPASQFVTCSIDDVTLQTLARALRSIRVTLFGIPQSVMDRADNSPAP